MSATITKRSLRLHGISQTKGEALDHYTPNITEELCFEEDLVYFNPLFAPSDGPVGSLIQILTRVENLSHILFWTRASTPGLDLHRIELPRLGLTFQERVGSDGIHRMYSLDHTSLFLPSAIPGELAQRLLKGIPHSICLVTENGELSVLVPNVRIVRPVITAAPFSTELVIDRLTEKGQEWSAKTTVAYFIYPIHVSSCFLECNSLSCALYLLLLRFLHRDYDEVAQLSFAIATDAELSAEQSQIFELLHLAGTDYHPDAHANRVKIALATADSPVVCPFHVPMETGLYLMKMYHISARCRLTNDEELDALQLCDAAAKKLDVAVAVCETFDKLTMEKLVLCLTDDETSLNASSQDICSAKKCVRLLTDQIRGQHGLYTSEEEATRLLHAASKGQTLPSTICAICNNRRAFLQAQKDGHEEFVCQIPQVESIGIWVTHCDKIALTANRQTWKEVIIRYKLCNKISSVSAVEKALTIFSGGEDFSGSRCQTGFLLLHEVGDNATAHNKSRFFTKKIPTNDL